jgi:hypothetical protein
MQPQERLVVEADVEYRGLAAVSFRLDRDKAPRSSLILE